MRKKIQKKINKQNQDGTQDETMRAQVRDFARKSRGVYSWLLTDCTGARDCGTSFTNKRPRTGLFIRKVPRQWTFTMPGDHTEVWICLPLNKHLKEQGLYASIG